LGTGLTVVGTTLMARPAGAQSAPVAFQPARHPQDDWLDEIPGKHRFVFDTTSPAGAGAALLYANNYLLANQNAYGLGTGDNAIVIVVRHNSTPFAYNDALWGKYGSVLAERSEIEDPKTKQRPTVNLYNAAGYGVSLPNMGTTVDSLIKRGVHFAVCQMATRRLAGAVAQATGSTADAIYKEITSNLVANAHMVAAGIVTVNRAQERGYTFANVG
jgi:intracellular sulfur oxidation DsrE/DsrF family protein